jgi:hypothetical protein
MYILILAMGSLYVSYIALGNSFVHIVVKVMKENASRFLNTKV